MPGQKRSRLRRRRPQVRAPQLPATARANLQGAAAARDHAFRILQHDFMVALRELYEQRARARAEIQAKHAEIVRRIRTEAIVEHAAAETSS